MGPKFWNLFKSIWYYSREILILVMVFELYLIAVKAVQKEALCQLAAVLSHSQCRRKPLVDLLQSHSPRHSPLFNETNRCVLEAIISNYICKLFQVYHWAFVALVVWWFDLQLPIQSVPITTDVVSVNRDQDKVYNIMC